MTPRHKALLTAAFAALGPERVTRDLNATGHSWRKEHFVSTLLGVRIEIIHEIVRAWDHEEEDLRLRHVAVAAF